MGNLIGKIITPYIHDHEIVHAPSPRTFVIEKFIKELHSIKVPAGKFLPQILEELFKDISEDTLNKNFYYVRLVSQRFFDENELIKDLVSKGSYSENQAIEILNIIKKKFLVN